MNKLVAVLSITIVMLSIVSGFLFYQFNAFQSLNSELRSQNAEVQNQLDELQIQNGELETQVAELQRQNSELQNRFSEQEAQLGKYTNLVKITDVEIEPGFHPYIALTLHNSVNVTIENLGVNDVEGLNLTIEHSSPSRGKAYILEVLRSGETRKITGDLFSVVGITGWVTVTLKLDEVIIDEYVIPKFPNTP